MRARIAETLFDFAGGRLTYGKVSTGAPAFTFDDPENRQLSEPVRAHGYYERETGNTAADEVLMWLYRNRVVVVDPPFESSLQEIIIAVKHVVISHERTFAYMQADIERFLSSPGEITKTSREPISEEVRLFVWRRDQGRCVRCGSNEKLEYDHIIALANGGSNTERNIQLLCETCNRSKGTAI